MSRIFLAVAQICFLGIVGCGRGGGSSREAHEVSTRTSPLRRETAAQTPPFEVPEWFVEERAVVTAGAAMLITAGKLPRTDSKGLLATLADSYKRMESKSSRFPERIANPGASQERADETAFIVPGDDHVGVVFMHGYRGNFSLQCWHVAEAFPGRPTTLCPSIGEKGDWWTSRGLERVKNSIQFFRNRGVETVFVAGISNGARGAAVHAPKLDGIAGLLLISGASHTRPSQEIPVLVVHGTEDTMFSSAIGQRYTKRAGPVGHFKPLSGGHFAFLEDYATAQTAVQEWASRLYPAAH